MEFNREQTELLKQTICKGASDNELALFLQVCKLKRLDPFSKQIYAIKRWDPEAEGGRGGYTMTFQVGIDGFRAKAEETGLYEGQEEPQWCGPDGVWKDVWLADYPPSAARVRVLRKGWAKPATGLAHYKEYVQTKKDGTPNSMWKKSAANQLAKCFSSDTEVLTDKGFERFDTVTGRILYVSQDGLQASDSRPFFQKYDGPMVTSNSDMLNFSVTPNHDMVTTIGKVEARAMFETSISGTRAIWSIPMTVEESRWEWAGMSDDDLRLAGAVAADGHHSGYLQFVFGVSRPYKIEALSRLSPSSTGTIHSKGSIAVSTREIRTNFDKARFSFECSRVAPLLDTDKRFSHSAILQLSKRQARLVIDTWQTFDGHTNKATRVRRIYTSNPEHVRSIELLCAVAGYSVNVPTPRNNDISDKTNFCLTISEPAPIKVRKPAGAKRKSGSSGIVLTENKDGKVWCATVPSGVLVVRRNGFSMLCGNCAEALAFRKGFPEQLGGLNTEDEMPAIEVEPEHIRQAREAEAKRQAEEQKTRTIEQQQQTTGQGAAVQQPTQPAGEVVDPDVQALWARMTNKESTLKVFAELKKNAIDILGEAAGLKGYYGFLGQFGVQHANEFKSTKPARQAAAAISVRLREVYDDMQREKAEAEAAAANAGAVTDDAPFGDDPQ